jgi:hypothetical protein
LYKPSRVAGVAGPDGWSPYRQPGNSKSLNFWIVGVERFGQTQKSYQLARLFARLLCCAKGYIARVCAPLRALQADENPAQSGNFSSSIRLTGCSRPSLVASQQSRAGLSKSEWKCDAQTIAVFGGDSSGLPTPSDWLPYSICECTHLRGRLAPCSGNGDTAPDLKVPPVLPSAHGYDVVDLHGTLEQNDPPGEEARELSRRPKPRPMPTNLSCSRPRLTSSST